LLAEPSKLMATPTVALVGALIVATGAWLLDPEPHKSEPTEPAAKLLQPPEPPPPQPANTDASPHRSDAVQRKWMFMSVSLRLNAESTRSTNP
jgi:hypothetical protein